MDPRRAISKSRREASVVRRGRKLISESRAAEIRAKLAAWRQTPEPQRISLRALAAAIVPTFPGILALPALL
jgi:hypothetical protein